MIPTTLAPFLSVRNAAKAVDFYKSAFGAEEIFRLEDPTGAVVSNLTINGYGFWVADESPENKNFSPETLNGGTVRMILTTEDSEAAFDRAIAAGATVVCPIRTEHAWRIGRVLDPFGHHWEIGKPLQKT
ncbi:MAG TPA: VOC family protein [Edaphobacter sp.]|jgi:PhnB protein|nr:VOC family protein [Edaphobacter sp.]